MKLESLRVLHLAKNQDRDCRVNWTGHPSVFHLNTCQRQVWIMNSAKVSAAPVSTGLEIYQGQEAYRFLLRWAAGLKSEVLGETDIFGQIKSAWKIAEATRDPSLLGLSSWIQRLFEDTKEIRTQYLQNLGGSSYGTLIRKWLKNRTEGPLFLVGAGQIAQSVAPVLL